MGTLMKFLGVVVALVGFIIFMSIQKHLPGSQKQNMALYISVSVVFISAIYFALGVIADKLDRVIRSLDRPQISPSSADADRSSAEEAFAGNGQAVRREPSL
jgi:hypothetical protein